MLCERGLCFYDSGVFKRDRALRNRKVCGGVGRERADGLLSSSVAAETRSAALAEPRLSVMSGGGAMSYL